jgi:hypothetical protein
MIIYVVAQGENHEGFSCIELYLNKDKALLRKLELEKYLLSCDFVDMWEEEVIE